MNLKEIIKKENSKKDQESQLLKKKMDELVKLLFHQEPLVIRTKY